MIGVLLPLLLAVRVATPTFSPAGGTYTSTQSVTVRTSSAGAAIYCTTDGSRPRRAASLRVSSPLSVSTSQTVRCIAASLDGRNGSRIASAAYVINAEPAPPAGWAAACAAEAEPTSGVVYVCNCDTGADADCAVNNTAASDSNPGTSKSAPKKTWTAALTAYGTLGAGGTVALCKGGRWTGLTGGALPANANCTAGAPCRFREYTPTWAGTSPPTLVSSGTSRLLSIYAAVAGLRILNLRMTGQDAGLQNGGSAIFLYPETTVTNAEVCNVTFDGFSTAIDSELQAAGNQPSQLHIRGSRFLNNCTNGILGYFQNSDIDGNYFDNNGHALCGSYILPYGPTTHSVYLSGAATPLANVRFINNEIYRNAIYPAGSGYVQGSPVKIKGAGTNVRVENNLIDMTPGSPSYPDTVTAMSMDNDADTTKAGFTDVVIARNRIKGTRGLMIAVSSTTNLVIENNLIAMDGSTIYDSPIKLSHKTPESRATAGVVRNNTIYFSGTSDGASFGGAISVAAATSGAGNIVTGNSVTIGGGTGGSCFRVGDAAKVAFMDNNHCYGAAGFATVNESTDLSYATWRSTYPAFDANSTTAAASFVAAPTDLTPSPGDTALAGKASTLSTCTVLGIANQPCTSGLAIDSPTWSPTATAKTRTGSPFDIGAMER